MATVANNAALTEYWFLFWDMTSMTVAALNLEEAEEELAEREAPLHLLFAVVHM